MMKLQQRYHILYNLPTLPPIPFRRIIFFYNVIFSNNLQKDTFQRSLLHSVLGKISTTRQRVEKLRKRRPFCGFNGNFESCRNVICHSRPRNPGHQFSCLYNLFSRPASEVNFICSITGGKRFRGPHSQKTFGQDTHPGRQGRCFFHRI